MPNTNNTFWNFVDVKVMTLSNAQWDGETMVAYLITLEGNYIATVRNPKYRDMIIQDIKSTHPDKEVRIIYV